MRFFRVCAIAAAVALCTGGVCGQEVHEVCYPSCDSYTGIPSTLTPWEAKNGFSISLPKFDSRDGRALSKVTIRTKVFFETEIFITCTTNCASYSGETNAGVRFGINPSSATAELREKLPQYWGHWGDWRPTDPTTQFDMTKRASVDESSGDRFFVPYTYPFFDIPAFVPDPNQPDGTPEKVWAYVSSDTIKSRIFYANDDTSYDSADGRLVTFSNINQDDPQGVPETYSDSLYSGGGTIKKLQFGTVGTPTPTGQEVSIGKMRFDGTNIVYEKVIDQDDFSAGGGGGIENDIPPQDILTLFSSTTPGAQIVWDTDATGFAAAEVGGGNWAGKQVTTGLAQMQIRYEYTGLAITQQDPQFVGFQGQSFQVHGYPGSYFHLISAPAFQMNGRFTYLANGHCNYKHTPCWTHPGTYIDDIAIIVDELLVRITAGAVGQGYSVRINDEPFHAHAHDVNETSHTDVREFVPTKFYDAATRLTVHLRSPLEIHLRTSLFALTIHNADHFFNIDSQLLVRPILKMGREPSSKYPHTQNGKPWFPEFPIHGFIGQTWANATYAHNKQYQGDVDDYVETRPYATESIYSQYFKKFDDKNMNWDN